RLTGGDVDGDGYFDYVSNAMHGDGFGNQLTNAGELYVFSGRKLSAKLGMLPPDPEPAPVLASSSLSRDGQTVQEAPAGQSGLRVTVTGEGFRPDTEVRINGAVVVARIPNDPQLAATQRIVELDDNPAIKNSVGPLAVRVRHTNPPSELSNEVIAGRLVGPEITAIDPKRKSTGKLVLRIAGRNFQGGATATVLGPNDQPVRIKAVVVQASDSVKVTVRASDAPPSGTPLRVRVVINGIQSNEVIVTTP
ncbi:MAG TPA: hypothetical protein VNO70_24940, partial [Blastocatellia bacterium]|nr:hypothetical protein [Blastocatellia bacterium]